MGDFLLHQNATVLCSHGGQATPTSANPRVMVSGQPTIFASTPWVIAGCPLVPPPLPPCLTAMVTAGSTRLTSSGQPLATQGSSTTCIPNGTPMMAVVVQTRVSAS
jgi:uncharacterized Zn-binding protein involved in type VI secretion